MQHESTKLNIIVAGFIVGGPLGGLVWHHLQYVLGLHRMGHRVLLVEDSDDYPSCYNPQTNCLGEDASYGLAFINAVFAQHGLQHRWAYYHQPTDTWFGQNRQTVSAFARKADLFLNLSGVNPLREEFQSIPVRAFVDTDPVFTQIRHLTEPAAAARAALHNRFFSFGENIGKEGCTIPRDGLPWRPTRQPVCLLCWPASAGNKAGRWTTVMQWDSYKTREHNGSRYGMKSASFADYFTLPQQTTETFALAVGSATAPKAELASQGWQLADPLAVTLNTETYQRFIAQSKGEWSVAKQGYVVSNSGWFSERTTGYLASGRPAVLQDTGFSQNLPTGRGLLAFSSPQEALEALRRVHLDYESHCRWAREVVEEQFCHVQVLGRLLEDCFTTAAVALC